METFFVDQRKKLDWIAKEISRLEADVSELITEVNSGISFEALDDFVFYGQLQHDVDQKQNEIGMSFGAIVNSLRSTLDNSMIYLVKYHCPLFDELHLKSINFPICDNEKDWRKAKRILLTNTKYPKTSWT